jgi:hypothetical protein
VNIIKTRKLEGLKNEEGNDGTAEGTKEEKSEIEKQPKYKNYRGNGVIVYL